MSEGSTIQKVRLAIPVIKRIMDKQSTTLWHISTIFTFVGVLRRGLMLRTRRHLFVRFDLCSQSTTLRFNAGQRIDFSFKPGSCDTPHKNLDAYGNLSLAHVIVCSVADMMPQMTGRYNLRHEEATWGAMTHPEPPSPEQDSFCSGTRSHPAVASVTSEQDI